MSECEFESDGRREGVSVRGGIVKECEWMLKSSALRVFFFFFLDKPETAPAVTLQRSSCLSQSVLSDISISV